MTNVVACALAVACGDAEVLARLGGPLGDATRAAAATRADHVMRMTWAATARAPVPAGLRGVHASWIEAGLVGLPARARGAVASGGGAGEPGEPRGGAARDVNAWLARWATATIPPMPPVIAGSVTSAETAVRVDAATLERWLGEVGADQLALALGAAGPSAVAAAARVVGGRLVAAAARIAVAPRLGALGPTRAAIERCRVALDDRALVRIGARAVAPHLDRLARLQLVHRLPRSLGLMIAEELAVAARGAVLDAPRWEALAAAVG